MKVKVISIALTLLTTLSAAAQDAKGTDGNPSDPFNDPFLNDSISEIVIVAYGTQSRRAMTSSIGSIKMDQTLKDVPANSADQLLQGRVSGISITTPSAGISDAPVVRIRGVSSITSGTSPLYVIDGIAIDNTNTAGTGRTNPLADLNSSDILSIDVLKDAAAAALYGSRAANGVILITTKQGNRGKTKVTYDGFFGFSTLAKRIETINAQQYVDIKNESVRNRYGTDAWDLTNNVPLTDGRKAFNLWYKDDGSYYDTDWNEEVYRTGIQHQHTVALSGGNDQSQFYVSANYNRQDGIVKGDRYTRYGVNGAGSSQPVRWLKVGASIKASVSRSEVTDGSRIKFGAGSSDGFPRLAHILPANMPAWNPDGTPYIGEGGYMGTYPNTVLNNWPSPAAMLYYGNGSDINILRSIGTVYAELRPVYGLTLKTQYGIDYSHTDDSFFMSSKVTGDKQNGEVINNSTRRRQETWTNTIGYLATAGNHSFDFLVGQEVVAKSLYRWGAQRDVLLDEKYQGFNGSWATTNANGGTETESALLSFFGRINYDYDGKYLLSLNFRRDGFSALSKNNRWGNFGGISAAWRISDEKFFAPLHNVVNDLKIKGSWGRVGNTDIDAYAAWSYYSGAYYGGANGYILSQIADTENLKWETSEKVNVGFSATLFNRLDVDFDYYHTNSTDLILSVPVSVSKGIPGNAITSNAGALTNQGIELNLSARIIDNKRFSWRSSFNITTVKNRVTALSGGTDELTSGTYNITKVGYSIGQLYLYPTNGVDEQTGRRIFVSKEGREVLYYYEQSNKWIYKDTGETANESDIQQVICGNTQPTYFGGWSNDFRYKNLDFSLLFQFSGGNKIYNATEAAQGNYTFWSNSKQVYENYWRPDRTNAKYSIPIYGDNYSNGYSKGISEWVENGDYLRLKNISVGYTFRKLPKAVGISSLRIYAQVQNLLTLTGYSGIDPEANLNSTSTTGANLQAGIDKHTTPHARTYTFGVNLAF